MKGNLFWSLMVLFCFMQTLLTQIDYTAVAADGSVAVAGNVADFVPVDDLYPDLSADNESLDISIQCPNLGMTWGFINHDCGLEIDHVGCWGSPAAPTSTGGCNPYIGDTKCYNTLPILCIKKLKLNRPPYPMTCAPHAMPGAFYCGWSGAFLALSQPIQGCKLTSQAVADKWCETTAGCGYRMADHGDGNWILGMNGPVFAQCLWNWGIALSGGWALYGYSNLAGVGKSNPPKLTRWWTKINNQPGNCWNSFGHW